VQQQSRFKTDDSDVPRPALDRFHDHGHLGTLYGAQPAIRNTAPSNSGITPPCRDETGNKRHRRAKAGRVADRAPVVSAFDPRRTIDDRSTAQRLTDNGCTWPGCQATLARCQIHHLHEVAHGGPTNFTNATHICTFHHWLVHHTPWTITRNPQGNIEVRRT
jgi:hypothetical protein